MSRLMAFVVLGLVAAAFGQIEQPRVELKTVKSIKEFKAKNPGLRAYPFHKQIIPHGTRYILGNRYAGDRIVAQNSNHHDYLRPQDVQLNLYYPQNDGQGAILTFIDITIHSSSSLNGITLVKGGVGHRYIELVIESTQTTTFDYTATFYGL